MTVTDEMIQAGRSSWGVWHSDFAPNQVSAIYTAMKALDPEITQMRLTLRILRDMPGEDSLTKDINAMAAQALSQEQSK